jgi:hypothetical protein
MSGLLIVLARQVEPRAEQLKKGSVARDDAAQSRAERDWSSAQRAA